MTTFIEKLEQRVRKVDSLLCIGLDPHPADLPEPTAAAARDFCLNLIKVAAPYAAAFKPNSAFFEIYGAEGWQALQDVIAAIPSDIPVILDAKRGDISSTAEAYANAIYNRLGAHAVTLNPYLGYDSLQPFLQDPEHGVFVLCHTSNPGAVDIQDLALVCECGPLRVYEKVAMLAQEWNSHNNLGLVVGATFPESLRSVRRLALDMWFLTPGIGAQGGDLEAALHAGMRRDGLGMLIPVARGISRAANPQAAAETLVNNIRRIQADFRAHPEMTEMEARVDLIEALADGLLEADCVRFGQYKLKSGLMSPIYIDLRRLASFPKVLADVAASYRVILQDLEFDRIVGLPYAALPIATAISLQTGYPMIYPRKEVKSYGLQSEVEGEYNTGERAVVIDDLATTGGSKFEIIEKLTAVGLNVKDVVVLIDRQSGASEALAEAGFTLHAVLKLTDLLDYWERTERVPHEKIQAVRDFLAQKGE
jgi:uridine monophosphate synthetase